MIQSCYIVVDSLTILPQGQILTDIPIHQIKGVGDLTQKNTSRIFGQAQAMQPSLLAPCAWDVTGM
jgi:hypothetical protein